MSEKKPKVYLMDSAQLMSEFDHDKNMGLDFSRITSGSHIKLWWKCSLGHSWIADVSKRFIGNNCPYCSGKKILPGFNDLATTHPMLIKEWDYDKNTTLRPDMLSKGSEEKVDKQLAKEQALLDKYGIGNLSDPEDRASVRKIAQELLGSGAMEAGMKISLAKPAEQLPISYQRAIMEQNFIMIRQLDRITKLLEK